MEAAGWALVAGIILTSLGSSRRSTLIIVVGTLVVVGALTAIVPGLVDATAALFQDLGDAGSNFVDEL